MEKGVEAFQTDLRSMEICGAHQRHATSTQEFVNFNNHSMQMEQTPVLPLPESPTQNTRNAGSNIRKSLAWNSAFFTSEGVLDPEELAIVNSTFRKTDSNVLPLIQEDLNKSFESNSTLDTDRWTIDNFEVELFDNVRASVQKSFGKPNEGKGSGSKTASRRLAKRGLCSSTKAETFVNTMIKPPVSTKKTSVSKHGSYGISKRDGGGNESKQPPSSVKPPRMASKPTITPNKRLSTPVAEIKNTGKTVSGNCRRGERSIEIPKSSSPSTLVPGSPTFSKKLSNTSRSLYTKSGCTISDKPNRNSQEPSKKKLDSRSVAISFSNSGVNSHLTSSKSIHESRNVGHLHSYLKSSSKFSLYSPNSSFDSFLSPSSSSSTSARTTKSPFSCAWSSSDNNTPLPSVIAESRKHDGNNSGKMEFKPSGLRLPSPKIGYFDMEKSLIGNSNSGSKAGLHSTPRAISGSGKVSDVIKLRSSSKPSPKENHDKIDSRYLGGQGYEKENLLAYELGRESMSEEGKVINMEQLEKRLSSLKMSLSEPNILESSEILKSILNNSGFNSSLPSADFDKKANGQCHCCEEEGNGVDLFN